MRRSTPLLGMVARSAAAVLLLIAAGLGRIHAEAALPALSGRVVDEAGVLSAGTQSAIESKLKTLEDQSGIQLVVATVRSLGGEEVEPYANRLFRAWKLGEAKKNDGVLVLVAPDDRKARIEVGYGLEGTLTDATSKLILAHAMTPRFKAGDYDGGIARGVDDIVAVLSSDKSEWQKRPDLQPEAARGSGGPDPWTLVFFAIFLVVVVMAFHRIRRRGGGGGWIVLPPSSSPGSWSSGSGPGGGFGGGSGSSDGGGFSGGGGSSGGGGASDSW